ncbi:CotH kinase family protein [Larkinella terrae]|uniref:T9SS type A sorting domain-containing protein n=1 Tax=Larkinella terrae TaxID=2025311 RepID=A0A7K0ESA3_9BACT|nr:CotH kinase family protein [Larkinella terrae]MRS64693.1 T9SS type A sorting domain-containing protein [Larkinella terrae]
MRLFLLFVLVFIACTGNNFAQTFTFSNLPIVSINTNNQTITDEPGILADLKIINNASGINSLSDPPNEHNGKAKVEFRGCSSQNFPKKSYGFELRDPANTANDLKDDLFGFPTESDWVLNASYSDKTFMRDALTFYMSNLTGNYASRTKYVELVIDGQYQGIYVLEERVKRDAGRVDVKKLDPADNSLPKLSGGYIVKIDKACGNNDPGHRWASDYASPGANPSARHIWATHAPNDKDITTDQFNYIKSYIQAFETAANGPTVCDAINGYSKYISDDAFIDHFLLQEMTSNADAYRFSSFFSKQRDNEGGKLRAGPIWDMSQAYGYLTTPFLGNTQSYQGWRYLGPGDPSFPVPFFWGQLLSCCNYRDKLIARYQQLRQTTLKTATLIAFIDSQYALLNQGAYDRNFQKWPILGVPIWTDEPSYTGATLLDEVNYLKTWITNRLNWMDSNIASVSNATCALPVVFSGFSLNKREEDVVVAWSTSSEFNNDHFVVERSTNAAEFFSLGEVPGRGNPDGVESYQFIDSSPFQGINYYRIRQVDVNGHVDFTPVKAINTNEDRLFPEFYPNPATDLLVLKGIEPGATIQVMDSQGRVKEQFKITQPEQQLSTRNYATGLYILHINAPGQYRTFKFIVRK